MDLKELITYTDEELGEIFNTITEIQHQRKVEKKNQLVANFKEAYFALKKAGICIYHDGVGIWTFEEFDFE